MADGLTAEQIAARPFSIGSSDAAAALNLVPQKSPFCVYQEKRQEIAPEDLSGNEAVELGTLLEPVVSTLFERRTGKTLHRVNNTIVHPRLPFMTCNIDRRVVGEKKLAEIKTAGHWAAQFDDWGEVGTDAVPFKYAVQVQHQLSCLPEYEAGYVPLLVAGQNFRLYEIPRDEEIIGMLEAFLTKFWDDVQNGIPPTPTTLAQAKERWPKSVGRQILANENVTQALAELKETSIARLHLEKAEKHLQGIVACYMADADTLMSADGSEIIATYKLQSRAEHIQKYSEFRVLRPK